MSNALRPTRGLAIVLIGALAAAALLAGGVRASAGAAANPATVKVLEYNLYQGNEFEDAYNAKSLKDLPNALAKIYKKVRATNFPARAKALAAIIKSNRPALVSLPESSLYRTQFPSHPSTKATHVLYDYPAILLKALGKLKLHYRIAAITNNTDIQLTANLPRGKTDFRYTDRIAVLARSDVSLANPQTVNYAAKGHVKVGGITINLPDGYVAFDATLGGHTFRYVGTHLSGFADDSVRVAQAQELVNGPLKTALPTVLSGDLNATPGSPTISTLTGAGLTDSWAAVQPGQAGLTCCHAHNLRGSGHADHSRIDYVLERGLRVSGAAVVGNRKRDRTHTRPKLWPSDHDGLVVQLAF